jgi:hypothetical protein
MPAILSEEDLRYWLTNEDWYFSQHTRAWLERTPRGEAAEVLARVAADAALEPRTVGNFFATLVTTAGLTPAGAIAGVGPHERKAGTRAALLLAHLGDARAVPALARVWDARESRRSQYHELIEKALTVYLSEPAHDGDLAEHAETLRDLARRLWQPETPRRDLTAPTADLLIAALRPLAAMNAPEDRALLREIADAEGHGPNRQRVRDAVREEPVQPLAPRPES